MQHSQGLMVVMIFAIASYTSWLMQKSIQRRRLMQLLANKNTGKKKIIARAISVQKRLYPKDCTPAPLTLIFRYLQSPRLMPFRYQLRMVCELPLISRRSGLFWLPSIIFLSSKQTALVLSSIQKIQ